MGGLERGGSALSRARMATVLLCCVIFLAWGIALGVLAGGTEARAESVPCGILYPCPPTTAPATTSTTPATTTASTGTGGSSSTTTKSNGSPTEPTGRLLPGSAFVGRAGGFSYIWAVSVAPSGRSLRGFSVQLRHGHCSDGGRYFTVVEVGSGSWPISSDYAATIGFHARHAYTYDRAGGRIDGQEWTRLHVVFAGNRVIGSVEDHFHSARLSCSSGLMHIRGNRVGSTAAPIATRAVVTGTYSGKSPDGPWRFRVYLPLSMVVSLTYHWRLHCPNGKVFGGVSTFYDIPLTRYSGDGDLTFDQDVGSVKPYGPRGDGLVERVGLGSGAILQPRTQTLRAGRVHVTYAAYFSASASVQIDQGVSELSSCNGGYDVTGHANRGASFPAT